MSTTDTNDTGGRATVRRILADLILLAEDRGLPEPRAMDASEGNGIATVDLFERAHLDLWNAALGDGVVDSDPYRPVPGKWLHTVYIRGRQGWTVHLSALTGSPDRPVTLDADTVAALEKVATVSAEVRVSDDRINEIVAVLNGFIVHEYEAVSDIVYGRAVYSREVTGSDWNLDQAVAWASEQTDVVEALGPNADGEAVVELVDGTTIEWIPAAKQWAVCVSDDEAEVSR